MTLRLDLICTALLLLPACGPVGSGDSDSESGSASSGSGDSTDSTGAPVPTTGDDPTTGGTTTEPTTAAPTTAEPTTAEPTTGEPATCPEDQQAWITVASTALTLPADVGYSPFGASEIGLPDGNLALAVAVGAAEAAPGVVILSPLGEVVSVNAGAASPMTFVHTLVADPNGGVIVLGQHGQAEPQAFMARFAADGAPLGEVPVGTNLRMSAMAIAGDAAVMVGLEPGTGRWMLGQYDIVTGAQQWQSLIAEEPGLILTRMVVDPHGDIFVAGAGNETDAGFTELRMWRFAGDGQPLWNIALVEPAYDFVTDLEVSPVGQILALRIGPFPEFSVDLVAVDSAGGDLAWEVNLAVPDPTGRPSATNMHLDADALTIPIVRSEPGKLGRRPARLLRWRAARAGPADRHPLE
jgi:hypothetical protein